MAKYMLVCSRVGRADQNLERRVEAAMRELAPDNLDATIEVDGSDGIVLGLLTPIGAKRTPLGLLLGAADEPWDTPGSRPDGSFAICRWTDDTVELVSDVLATRTIWWVLTDDLLIASSSQAAISSMLGDVRFDDDAAVWMLATGTLGPEAGWDARVRRVRPDAVVRLDRRSWSTTAEERDIVFAADPDPSAAAPALASAVAASFDAPEFSAAPWTLPLSGGADSRGILQQLLRAGTRPTCITWGREDALSTPGTDAAVARALAVAADLPHEYLVVEPGALPPETLMERFLVNGEGRVDHIAGYLDGFEAWRIMHERGIVLVARGDEAFGWTAVDDEREARASVGLTLLNDLIPPERRAALGLPENRLPEFLERRAGESIAAWRDRLYHQFRVPVVLAALTDLKLAYVELVNPLMSRRIVDVVRRMPDALRTEKRAWVEIVERGWPNGPFARSGALLEVDTVLRGPAFRAYLRREIRHGSVARAYSPALAAHLLAALTTAVREPGVRLRLMRLGKALAPGWMIRLAKRRRTKRGPRLDHFTLALRAVLAAKMRDRLEQVAARGRAAL